MRKIVATVGFAILALPTCAAVHGVNPIPRAQIRLTTTAGYRVPDTELRASLSARPSGSGPRRLPPMSTGRWHGRTHGFRRYTVCNGTPTDMRPCARRTKRPHDPIRLYHDHPIYTSQSKINCAGEYDARPRPTPFREQHRKERSPS